MHDLLERVLAAHGGLDRWNTFNEVRTTVVTGGTSGRRKVSPPTTFVAEQQPRYTGNGQPSLRMAIRTGT
jgi:hypothetical protein